MNMKFIRKARRKLLIRDRALDLLSKALLIGISVLVCLWMVSGAHAASISITGIKSQALSDGSYAVDFSLSQKIAAENVSVEFDRNFIQVSLKGVSAYPARTETINEGSLEKVFTYQYQPDLARARVLLKTTAASLKGKSSWKVTADGVRLTVRSAGALAQTISDSVKGKSAAITAGAPSTTNPTGDAEEERIVQEILNDSKVGTKAVATPSVKPTEDSALSPEKKGEDQMLFPSKAGEVKPKDSSATRVIASLLLVIGVIGACAVAFRRFAMGKGMPFLRQNQVIETIATHGLGPKRSVAVIKVLDQYMVIGMAGDSMNLLANLGTDVKIDKYLDQIGGPGSSFRDSLDGALGSVTAGSAHTDTAGPPLTHKAAQIELGIRSSIKKRIAGFKPL